LEFKEDKSVGIRSFKLGWLAKGAFAFATIAFLAAAAVPANAASLRRAAGPGANGNGANGGPTGNYLFTWYDVGFNSIGTNQEPFNANNGDNVMRLADPNGCSNGGVGTQGNCHTEIDECALIYVFDDDQEMGECCGCPITPDELETYSVKTDLTANWLQSANDNGSGTIVVVGSASNAAVATCSAAKGCNAFAATATACDPTAAANVAGATNLDGSMTHSQTISAVTGLTEIALFDQGAGDPTNDAFLPSECASIIGVGSGPGVCHCPTDEAGR